MNLNLLGFSALKSLRETSQEILLYFGRFNKRNAVHSNLSSALGAAR